MTKLTILKYPFVILLSILLLPATIKAQLKAGFSMDKSAGCAPLAVAFTNTTTGASAAATYLWDFGNGNTSVLRSPGALFQVGQTYTVTLTVTDGTQRSSASGTVTVYKKPEVDFAASASRGCAPFQVTFTSSSAAGSGTVGSYFWDFGDGTTMPASVSQVAHVYTAGVKQSVSLTVTNSYGCQSTKRTEDLVELLPVVKADFVSDKTFLCSIDEKVGFTNNSSGEGVLSYSWDFGDGTTSTQKDPEHVFHKKGAFPVRLAVSSSLGCSDTVVRTAYLNVANFQSAVTAPAVICKGSEVVLKNGSTPRPTGSSWTIDGAPAGPVDTAGAIKHTFTTLGVHTIQLANQFGACSDTTTSTVEVKGLPSLKGFIAEPQGVCGAPVTVNFRDTTSGATAWGWNFERLSYPLDVQSTLQAPSKHFYGEGTYRVTLWVTDAAGCKNSVEQEVNLRKPQVYIRATDNNGHDACDSLVKRFKMETEERLTSFTWHFSDGTTSKETEPEHVFKPGNHRVWLTFTNDKGCTNTTYYGLDIQAWTRPGADFASLTGTTVCGNLPVRFTRLPEVYYPYDYWVIDGKYAGSSYYSQFEHRFTTEGKHTVMHIVYNEGCRDTVTKVNYIDVKFPFPKISEVKNTCDGNRDLLTFRQTSRGAETWTWDFGDGTVTTLKTDVPAVTHTYAKTGEYKVRLTTTNGACTVQDSVMAYAFLKQKPLVTANKVEVCMDEGLSYTLTNVEKNPYPYIWIYHYISAYSYNDGTTTPVGRDMWDDWDYWVHGMNLPFKGHINRVEKGKDSVRIITLDAYYRCPDTSNYLPIKVLGAVAGFKVEADNNCYTVPALFQDTSNAYNTTIRSREWNFGDGMVQTLTQGGTLEHRYAAPGTYNVTLKVTDASGCTSTTSTTAHPVRVSGPKAAFSASATNVVLNTRVQFYNTTNTVNSPSTVYEWQFGDGATSSAYSPSHTFAVAGDYTVKLIATNGANGCTDTAILKIKVAEFTASFTLTTGFVGSSTCPPVVVRLVNTSRNYRSVRWDFGDGSTAEGMDRPSHVYTAPGTYPITLVVTNENGLTGTFTDTVVVRKPTPLMAADVLHGCTSQSITFSAKAQQGVTFLWDLGDGMVANSADSFYRFHYSRHGVFHPAVVVKDANGCLAAASLPQPVVIDSLLVDLAAPSTICTPREVTFRPTVVSIAPGGAVERSYHWDFGTGAAADTSNLPTPSFTFSQPGNYTVRLAVATPYGCRKEVSVPIKAFQGVGAVINGPQAICEGESATFTGSTRLPGQPTWKWNFHDGTSAGQATAPPKTYSVPGTFPVQLLVDNVGCVDTLTTFLKVHPKPVVRLSPAQAFVCEGASVVLTASGGSTYSWAPATGLGTTAGATITASPTRNTIYTVTATSDFGCTASGTATLTVVYPPEVQLPAAADVCAGESVQLKASGAAAYQWIGNTAGLSAIAIGQPMAAPAASTVYTVVGTDAHRCFNDTASIAVAVKPRPTVDAGPSVELLAGASLTLQPTASADVVRWTWSPPRYLSCSGCAAPDVTPLEPTTYTLTVANADGCTASDTVSVSLLCTESRVYIPNTFTPNHDGVNDVFALKGYGIRQVKSLRIYNRWGEVVFERKDFEPGDRSAAWDGRYKGLPVPVGSYVYIAEMSCNGQEFTRRGTVTVVY